jgi:hypothetical protein
MKVLQPFERVEILGPMGIPKLNTVGLLQLLLHQILWYVEFLPPLGFLIRPQQPSRLRSTSLV